MQAKRKLPAGNHRGRSALRRRHPLGNAKAMRLLSAMRPLLLAEFVSAAWLAVRYFFKPKATINYPFERNPQSPRFRWRACVAPVSERRGALHRLQAVRGGVPG